MCAMQIKRGTTESWLIGPELLDFNSLAIKNRDGCINAHNNTVDILVGGPSRNTPAYLPDDLFLGDDGKVFGLDVITPQEFARICDDNHNMQLSIKVDYGDAVSTGLFTYTQGLKIMLCYSDECILILDTVGYSRTVITHDIKPTEYPQLFVYWDKEVPDNFISLLLTVSVKDKGQKEGLLPGQLGCELTEDGNTLLKVGPHNTDKNATPWSEISYVGQVLPQCMYGTSEDRQRDNPIPHKGQIYFLESQTTPGAYYITIHNGQQWSDETAST